MTVRSLILHLSLIFAVILYLIFGGLCFHFLENSYDMEQQKLHDELVRQRSLCHKNVTKKSGKSDTGNQSKGYGLEHFKDLYKCNVKFDLSIVSRQNWNVLPSVMFAFTIITTIGYGNVAPVTSWGRCFCIIYGLIGIPLTMLIIANLGKFLMTILQRLTKKICGKSAEDGDLSTGQTGIALLVAFALYITIGALILPLYEREMDFFSAIYFNFVTLTTVGLGDFVPSSGNGLLLFSLIYITIGLALTTLAIEVASDYLKKLHYFGRKFTNVGNVNVWFGGKTLSINGLVKSVGAHVGATPEQILEALDSLDALVDKAIDAEQTNQPIQKEMDAEKAEKDDENQGNAGNGKEDRRDDVDENGDNEPLLGATIARQTAQENIYEDVKPVDETVTAESETSAKTTEVSEKPDQVAIAPTLGLRGNGFQASSFDQTNDSDLASDTAKKSEPDDDFDAVSVKYDEVSLSHAAAETMDQQLPELPTRPPEADMMTPSTAASSILSDDEPHAQPKKRRARLPSHGGSVALDAVMVKVPHHEVGRRGVKHDPKKVMELYQQEWARMPGRRGSVQSPKPQPKQTVVRKNPSAAAGSRAPGAQRNQKASPSAEGSKAPKWN